MHAHAHGAAGGALGAARLAWLADGGSEDEVCRVAEIERAFLPDAAERSILLPRHERFRTLYPALRDQFGSGRGESAALAR